ncbi:hypothetical protein D3C76_1294670 [compost metagenome]
MMVAFNCWPGRAGRPPNWPEDTWTFWAATAVRTSTGVNWYLFSLAGSSQIRIAYWAPNTWKSPTPAVREIGSCMLETM